ncbi:MAG: hypothetical protein K1060chlam5_00879 [Candidatus Anoxychlamydiales bacterium]|nr:hypothetical protein [Candidatus Anoxychlamydiales bacterium]
MLNKEKNLLDAFLDLLEKKVINIINDFSNIDMDNLEELRDSVFENKDNAKQISKSFLKNFEIFEKKFTHFVDNFKNISLIKTEESLEDFSNNIQMLKKELFNN